MQRRDPASLPRPTDRQRTGRRDRFKIVSMECVVWYDNDNIVMTMNISMNMNGFLKNRLQIPGYRDFEFSKRATYVEGKRSDPLKHPKAREE